ncbi:phenylalanine--tRNA ligase subunit beta [Enterobacteriaceae endosymbiont of Donacia cincticornis]|uniref:phenylalanine--tRNA ligase subunit beta n=1 Tax=Enterobacteriaceae endosymbiont of Donacia cincticornis TaxID=2675773 RepID=UPI0014498997|nr:phenylalanine--tRNA ligase subunit beta [Enterobacteriaceae endosymbiont of Donacia cincticornis]QJC36004.1 phenylalanine--tRNA ligase subunit beta [Enterobacteriaceae endosymbiont of Donacia cincticornis]
MIKFSEFWLREWFYYDKDIYSLSKKMTMLGFEIEKIESITYSSDIKQVIKGKILNYYIYKKNPKIYEFKILTNNGKLLKIFSNINCFHKKMKIILATKNSFLYKKYIKIPKYFFLKESEGLLCTPKIISLYTKYNIINNNITFLNRNNSLKKKNDTLYLYDNILHINIPTNRLDCLNILGLTRDLSVLNKKNKFSIPYKNYLIENSKKYQININYDKKIKNILYQYNYCIIKNINLTKKIPFFIKERLYYAGIKFIPNNPLLNIRNYIILELGYPIQFYNYNKINGKIYIKKYQNNKYYFYNLTNKKTNLLDKNSLLTIVNNDQIMSIPGIIQNKNYSVRLTTKNILVECLFLSPKYINLLLNNGCNINNTYNFHKNTLDPLIQKIVLIRTINLLLQIFKGKRSKIYTININNINNHQKIINLSFKHIYKILGFNIKKKIIFNILNKLGFIFIKKTMNNCIIKIPSWRYDVNIVEDVIEEIIRVYGYNHIPQKINISLIKDNIIKKNYSILECQKINIKKIKDILIYQGYHEVINYSFINPKIQLILYPKIKCIKIKNPLTIETSVMRNSLSYGLINNIIYNKNRQQKNLRFFEYGLCFFKDFTKKIGISQKFMLAGIVNVNSLDNYWNKKNKCVNFYDIKGNLEYILNVFSKNNKIEFYQQNKNTILHPYINSSIYINSIYVGYIGMLHPRLINYFNIDSNTFFFELFYDNIIINNIFNFEKIINYPINKRDISFFVKKNINFNCILLQLQKLKLKNLIKIKLIDIFQGNNIPKKYKNITLSLFLQDKNHTLNDIEINNIINKCILELKNKFQIILRDNVYYNK